MKYFNCLLTSGTIFCLIALTLIAVSFATDHWLDTVVDRTAIRSQATSDNNAAVLSALSSDRLYFTRYRGIFRTCYPGNETVWLVGAEDRVDGWCIAEKGYELSRDPDTVNYGSDYETRIHLMRSHFGMYVVGILFLVFASVLSGAGCWTTRSVIIKVAGAMAALGAFFCAAGIAMFHGYEYLENSKIAHNGFYAYYKDLASYQLLVGNSTTVYGYSYILGWVGVGAAFLGAILILCTAFTVEDEMRDAKRYDDEYTLSNRGHGRGSRYDDYYDDYGSHYGPYPYYDKGYRY